MEASLRKNGRVTEIVCRDAFRETGQKAIVLVPVPYTKSSKIADPRKIHGGGSAELTAVNVKMTYQIAN